MKRAVILLAVVLSATHAYAEPITWFGAGTVESVGPNPQWAGLTVGTPWTLKVTFDSSSPGTQSPGFGIDADNCYNYPMAPATLVVGPYQYTSSSGLNRVWTNAALPGTTCTSAPFHATQFALHGISTADPGAWNLFGTLLTVSFNDQGTTGGLPTVPPAFAGFSIHEPSGAGIHLGIAPLTAVPEPGTLTMLGLGVVCIARRTKSAIRRRG